MSIFLRCTHFRTTPEWNPADAVSAAVVGDSRSSHRHVYARPAPGTATLSVRVRAVGSSRVSEPAPGVADTCVEAAAVGVPENTGARPRPLGEALLPAALRGLSAERSFGSRRDIEDALARASGRRSPST